MLETATPVAVHPRVIEIVVDCHDPKRLRVSELDQAALRAVDLGGRQLAEHDERGRQWRVMADPEGNEFCLTL